MTRPRQAKYYPAQFFDLADSISKDKTKVVTIDFPTKEDAKAFRLEFYSFRSCAEKEGLTEAYPELCAITIVDVKPERRILMVMHKDFTPSALALEKSLEKK